MRDVRALLDAYGRALVWCGAAVFLLALGLDRRWLAEPLPTLALVAAVVGLRAAPVRLSKYSYLTQTAIVALTGALAFGSAPVILALGVGVGLGDFLILRKPARAAAINAGREVLAFAAAFGVYAGVLRFTGVRAFSLDWLPAGVAFGGAYFFATRILFYFTLLVRDKLESEERLLILRYEIVSYVLSLLAAGLVLAAFRTLDPPGWFAVLIVLGLLGLLTRRIVEEAITAEDLNKVHLMETAVASNLTLEASLEQIERLAHRLLDWGDLRIYRAGPGGPALEYRSAGGRAGRGAPPSALAALRQGVVDTGQLLSVNDAQRDTRVWAPDADVQSLVIAPVRFGGEVTGTLELEHHKRHAYRARDITAVTTIATQVATAMHIADLRRPLVATIGQIGEQVSSLAGTTEAMRSGAGSLTTAAAGLTEAVAEEEAFVQAGLAATSGLAAAARAMAAEAGRVAEASRAAAATARGQRAAIGDALTRLDELKRFVVDGAGRVAELGQETRGIEGVISSIRELADLTDLISLNAAIEAARAGRDGRGFAVVAGEVRQLAAQSTAAAREASRLLTAVTERVQDVAARIGRGEAAVAGVEGVSGAAADGLEAIVASVGGAEREAERIAAAAARQLEAAERLGQEIERLAQVAGRTRAGATTLLAQAGESARGQADLERATRRLEAMATELQAIARHFTGHA
jgi:methyl-accepting chemotaxis protein